MFYVENYVGYTLAIGNVKQACTVDYSRPYEYQGGLFIRHHLQRHTPSTPPPRSIADNRRFLLAPNNSFSPHWIPQHIFYLNRQLLSAPQLHNSSKRPIEANFMSSTMTLDSVAVSIHLLITH
jgi:hypothetical protein